jgi:endoglucanase
MTRALALLRRLTSVPTAPYQERAVTRQALGWIKENLGRAVSVKRCRGGVVVRYQGNGQGPSLALAAHLDHPGFRLRKVTPTGAEAELQGGLPAHLLEGCAVEAFAAGATGNVPSARGVLGPRPKKGPFFHIRWTQPPERGARPAFAILALTPYTEKDGWLLSRSIDDLLGCAISLEVLRRVVQSKVKTNLTILLHRAEEVGFMGALDLIHEAKIPLSDSILSIEASRALPGARPGKGPVIRLGDKACLFDPNLIALLDQAALSAKRRGAASQRLRLTGGTCEATAYQAFGYETAGVAVPLVNYHNGWGAKAVAPEMVRLKDVASCVLLLEQAARLFASAVLRGELRARLERRHRLNLARLYA